MKNLFEIKTTIVGALFLVGTAYYFFTNETTNTFYVSVGVIIGLGLLFAPDSLILGLKRLIGKKTK